MPLSACSCANSKKISALKFGMMRIMCAIECREGFGETGRADVKRQ
jgi:hypothetical protein